MRCVAIPFSFSILVGSFDNWSLDKGSAAAHKKGSSEIAREPGKGATDQAGFFLRDPLQTTG